MAAQMLKTLKGKVLDDLSTVQKEALKRAAKPTAQAAATEAPVDKEGTRFADRLAQDRMEGGFGFVMTANSVGDNHFAREQTAAFKRAEEYKREMEAAALSDFEASKARAATEALEKEREADTKATKSFAWGAASLKAKRSAFPLQVEAEQEDDDQKTKRQKTAAQDKGSETEAGPGSKAGGTAAATDGESSGALAGLGICGYGSSSSSSDSDAD